MTVEFHTTSEERHAAIQADHRSRWLSRTAVRGTLFVVIAVFMHAIIFGGNPQPNNRMKVLLPWVVIVCVMCALWAFVRLRSWVLRRVSERQPNQAVKDRWEIGEIGITINSGTVKSDVKWAAFQKYLDRPTLFLLYLADGKFLVMPKRALGDSTQLTEFSEMLSHYIPQ